MKAAEVIVVLAAAFTERQVSGMRNEKNKNASHDFSIKKLEDEGILEIRRAETELQKRIHTGFHTLKLETCC